jgi:hypothetical protein
MTPFDAVPSTIQVVLWPMFEGIGLGLIVGFGIMLVLGAIDRFFVVADRPAEQPAPIGRYRPLPPREGARPRLVSRPELIGRRPLARAT